MSFSAHSAFLCDRLLNMFCSAAYKLAPPFGHIKVELCPGSNLILGQNQRTPVFMRHNPLCVIISQSSILLTIPVAFMLVSPCRNYFTKILSAFAGRIYGGGNDISFITFSRIPASRTSFQQQAESARIAALRIDFDMFINFFMFFLNSPLQILIFRV